jgi:hypothetical protein
VRAALAFTACVGIGATVTPSRHFWQTNTGRTVSRTIAVAGT